MSLMEPERPASVEPTVADVDDTVQRFFFELRGERYATARTYAHTMGEWALPFATEMIKAGHGVEAAFNTDATQDVMDEKRRGAFLAALRVYIYSGAQIAADDIRLTSTYLGVSKGQIRREVGPNPTRILGEQRIKYSERPQAVALGRAALKEVGAVPRGTGWFFRLTGYRF